MLTLCAPLPRGEDAVAPEDLAACMVRVSRLTRASQLVALVELLDLLEVEDHMALHAERVACGVNASCSNALRYAVNTRSSRSGS